MKSESRLACIDDHVGNLELFKLLFCEEFQVDTFESQKDFFSSDYIGTYSAILVDYHLRNEDGYNLVANLQKHPLFNCCPIIFISGSIDEEVKLKCLKLGAHDFIHRSTKIDEITLRIKNKVQLFEKTKGLTNLGNLSLDLQQLKVYLSKDYVDVTLTELKILRLLVKNVGQLTSRDELYNNVWPGQKIMPTTLNTHLSNLRHKFEMWNYEIVAEKSLGYLLRLKV